MSENHCKDCCCARSWNALGITEYTGKSISEEIQQVVRERDDLLYCNDFVGRRVTSAESKIEAIQKFVNAQAEDEGLWCEAVYASEAYIQHGLRGCHAFIESIIKDGPRVDVSDNEQLSGEGD